MGFIDCDPFGLEVSETWNYVQKTKTTSARRSLGSKRAQ